MRTTPRFRITGLSPTNEAHAMIKTIPAGFLSALITASAAGGTAVAAEQVDYEQLETKAVELLVTETDIVGHPLRYPQEGQAQVSAYRVTVQPGDHTAWHHHEVPVFVHVLEGELTVDYGENGIKQFKAGDAFMEAVTTRHEGLNKSTSPVQLLTVYFGSTAEKNMVED
jgi:quercetin dioxygenase-like cupin family protein